MICMEDDIEPSDATQKSQVNVVFFGPSGCGKSTTVGHLIADSGAIDELSLERIAREAAEDGAEDRRYAWILDKLRCERERGGTMFQALWRLRSQRCRFTIIDAPGHDDFTKDIVTAMSQADIAVLVVTAVQAVQGEVQIREHGLLAHTLGLRQIVVCVNKMDCESVAYEEILFARACGKVRQDLEDVGLKTHDVHFVPISGWIGDNVACRSENMPWYCGPTLLEAMDDAVASHFKPEYPLRLEVHNVMQIVGQGVVAVGRVATGSLRPGMNLVFAPGGVRSEVLSIRMHHESLDEAHSGESVNVFLDRSVSVKDLQRGMVGSAADEALPASECSSFLARVIVLPPSLGHDRPSREIAKDCSLWVECHTAQVLCKFEELLSRTDRRTGKVIEENPAALMAGDAAVVRLRPEAPFCLEAFSEYPPLGRFAVRDQKTTVAVGVVQQICRIESDELPAGLSTPVRQRTPSNRSVKVHSRHSAVKPKAHGRSSPVIKTVTASASGVQEDSGEELSRIIPSVSVTADSGEDSPRRQPPPFPFMASGATAAAAAAAAQSPFLAFGPAKVVAKNPSPFAAFGAVSKKKVRELPADPHSLHSPQRLARVVGTGGMKTASESDS